MILKAMSCLNPLESLILVATGKVIKLLTNSIPTTLIEAEITKATMTINNNWIHFGMPITFAYSSSNESTKSDL
ncbi:Uncharacterised protein [Staphylococcus aureus]|nr:Uncharacterised protein [Staphylococcus aureus]